MSGRFATIIPTHKELVEQDGWKTDMTEQDEQSLVRSKQRVVDHGEVFTPDWLVEDMLDHVSEDASRIDARVLEPACGSGNFLAPVLSRKLATVKQRYMGSDFELRHFSLLAVMSIYGIELLNDNVDECRLRLKALFTRELGKFADDELLGAAAAVLAVNIVQGDALSMMTVSADPSPITFPEWSYLGRGKYQRRDFRFDVLTTASAFGEGTLFQDMGKHEIFMPVRDFAPMTIGEIASV